VRKARARYKAEGKEHIKKWTMSSEQNSWSPLSYTVSKTPFICSLSCDRSIASSTTSSPPSATYCFLCQIQFQIFTFPSGHAVAVYVFFTLSSLYLLQFNFCEKQLMYVTQKYDFALGSSFGEGSQTVRCLWPVMDIMQFKTHWTEVQSCLQMASWFYYTRHHFTLCSIRPEISINSYPGF